MIGPLELAANAIVTVSIVLAARNSVHTWWTGIIGCALFGVLFAGSQLYADASLQVFFIAASAVGWWQWRHPGARGRVNDELPITRSRGSDLAWALAIGLAVSAAYGALLHRYSDAFAPFVDSAVLVFSIIAQCLMVRRKVDCWPVWLLVNTISVPLYASRGLHLTAVLYAAYWVNAIVAWRRWHRQANEVALAAA